MPDETPTGDKAVYVFIEMIALGFVLYAIEEAFKDHPSWAKVGISSALGLLFFLMGVNWAKLKGRIHSTLARRIADVSNDYRYRYGLALLLIGMGTAYIIVSLHSIRSDLDAYVMQRSITKEQAAKLSDYLSQRESGAVSIRVVQHDPEAMEYAAQLFNAMRQTNWDINPPNHGGPEYQHIPTLQNEPKVSDLDANGKRLYKTIDEYMGAHDAWFEIEMSNKIAEQNYDATGLCVEVEMTGQPVNPDPRHPAPESILQDGLRYAGIEANCSGSAYSRSKYTMYLLVGHRPRILGNQEPTLRKVGRWIERLGQ